MEKKNWLLHVVLMIMTCQLVAQELTVGVNIENPNPNAVLHLVAPNGDQGLIVPKLTTAQREAMTLATEDSGLMVYDETENMFYFWNGTDWTDIANGAISSVWEVATDGSGAIAYENGNVGVGTTSPRSQLQVGRSLGLSNFVNNSDTPSPISGNFIGTNIGADYTNATNNQLRRISGNPAHFMFMDETGISFLGVTPGGAGSLINIGDGGDVFSILDLEETGHAQFAGGVSFGNVDPGFERDGMIRFDDGGSFRLQVFNAGAWENIALEAASVTPASSELILTNNNASLVPDVIGSVIFEGTTSGNIIEPASFIDVVATEDWTNTATGSALSFSVVPTGFTGPVEIVKMDHTGTEGFVNVDGNINVRSKLITEPNTATIIVPGTNFELPPPDSRIHIIESDVSAGPFSIQRISEGNAISGQELILIVRGATIVTILSDAGSNILLSGTGPPIEFPMNGGDTLHLIYMFDPLGDGNNYWMEIGRSDRN